MSRIDTTNIDALSGAVFFSVGRGTEGAALRIVSRSPV